MTTSWTPPPNWPQPPTPDWQPPSGWAPDPAWGPAPRGWNFHPDRRSWPRRHVVLTCALAFVAVLIISGGIGAAITPSKTKPAQSPSAAAAVEPSPSVTVAVTASPSTRQTHVPSPRAAIPSPTRHRAPAPTSSTWVMPDLVGHNLQAAQDAIQALTHDGIFFTHSHDLSGADRFQILDADWQVCNQNVAPGARINPKSRITFGVVKQFTETCP
jgi:hypothetical protein